MSMSTMCMGMIADEDTDIHPMLLGKHLLFIFSVHYYQFHSMTISQTYCTYQGCCKDKRGEGAMHNTLSSLEEGVAINMKIVIN